MSISESIQEKVNRLPSEKQQEFLDFIEFLTQKTTNETEQIAPSEQSFELQNPQTPLGKTLHEIRQRAIVSGMHLVSSEDIANELSKARKL